VLVDRLLSQIDARSFLTARSSRASSVGRLAAWSPPVRDRSQGLPNTLLTRIQEFVLSHQDKQRALLIIDETEPVTEALKSFECRISWSARRPCCRVSARSTAIPRDHGQPGVDRFGNVSPAITSGR
jgi:hypothetical protein